MTAVSDAAKDEAGVAVKDSVASSKPMTEDPVDRELHNTDGKVIRKRDPNRCRHNAGAKCPYCLPIDPYDETYLASREIKHMSFHAHLRRMLDERSRTRSKQKFYPLDPLVCHVLPGCDKHKPWPLGSCSSCVPGTITLSRQKYRHVDNVMFENDLMVDNFLNFWRKSGHQRIGILIGQYSTHADVPLGIKAQVAAIYEPPQTSTEDTVQLLVEETESELELVDILCQQLGLVRVGWIFTDLTPKPDSNGAVQCTRSAESYLLSAEECITAGWLQNKHPNITKYAKEGIYGSKFVTVVCSGDAENQVHFAGYQVSNQCAALVGDDILVPIPQCPELAYVRDKPTSPQHYIPDVKFTEKDQYGNEVTKDGRPLPVEYLLVDVPCGRPVNQEFSFYSRPGLTPFAIENRLGIGELQNMSSLASYDSQCPHQVQPLDFVSDFHLLLFLLKNDVQRFSKESLQPLLNAVKNRDVEAARQWLNTDEHWLTVIHLMEAGPQVAAGSTASGGSGGAGSSTWQCAHCTMLNNHAGDTCEMCQLPRS